MKKIAANCFVYIFMAAFVFLADAQAAQPGRAHVFAWLSGGDVLVECAVPSAHGAQPVNNGQITVFDNVTNKQLVQGRTNARGRFSFKVPQVVRAGHGLRIEVNAGNGNVSDWVMSAAELYEAAALTAGFESAQLAGKNGGARAVPQQGTAVPQTAPQSGNMPLVQEVEQPASQGVVSANGAATPDHVRQIVNESLTEQLAPIHKRMASMEARGSSIVEVIGGIGWLIGLIGLWLYFRSRKQS